jgi:hypothetical protein
VLHLGELWQLLVSGESSNMDELAGRIILLLSSSLLLLLALQLPIQK